MARQTRPSRDTARSHTPDAPRAIDAAAASSHVPAALPRPWMLFNGRLASAQQYARPGQAGCHGAADRAARHFAASISASWASRVIRLRELATPGTLAAGADHPVAGQASAAVLPIPGLSDAFPHRPSEPGPCLRWRYAPRSGTKKSGGGDSRSRQRRHTVACPGHGRAACVPGSRDSRAPGCWHGAGGV